MKLRTVMISIVVSAALIGGAGYGAYYAMQGKKSPVEVVPVSNVSMGYYNYEQQETVYGTVTSQIAQTVMLNDEYPIDEIFVKAGDKVQEGTPLFSYDMTMQELELEMQQLELQTNELTMTRLEKELEKLKRTPTSASLVRDLLTLTAMAADADAEVIAEQDGMVTEEIPSGSAQPEILPEESEDTGLDGQPGDAGGVLSGNTGEPEIGDVVIEGAEIVGENGEAPAISATENSVLSYENLVYAIQNIFLSCGDQLKASEVEAAVREAVQYYRKNLAEEKITQEPQADGSIREIREYVIREAVLAELDEAAAAQLRACTETLDQYQTRYVELLIQEVGASEETGYAEAVQKIREAYDLLATKQQYELGEEYRRKMEELLQETETDAADGTQETETLLGQQPYGEEETTQGGDSLPLQDPGGTTGQTDQQQTESGDPDPGAESEIPDTGTEGETTETESGAGTEIQSESETETQAGTEPQTESETRTKYRLTVKYPALDIQEHYEGDTVTIQADMDDVTLEFLGWKLQPTPETMTEEDLRNDRITFVMPPFDLTAEAQYQNAPDAIESYAQNFLAIAEELLAEGAEQSFAEQARDYESELESAIVFYQQWLAVLPAEILDGTSGESPELEKYQLKDNVRSYLKGQGKKAMVQQMKDDYRELCLLYAKKLFLDLDAGNLDKDKLNKATEIYNTLGDKWRKELEKRWQQEFAGQTEETDENGEPVPQPAVPGIGDSLAAYGVLCQFQEYQKLPPETSEEERYMMLQNIWNAFMILTEEQQAIASADPLFVETLKAYGLWEETEPETEPFPDYGGWGDLGGDEEPLYTAEELQEMIWNKEQEIKDCELDIRQSELDLRQKERILDEKIIKSTMEGTVISIGDSDGNSDEDYFVKVANEAGLYARGSMNELALEKLHVGDQISGTLLENGTAFTATIKEISEYPDPNGDSMSYGSGNTNASYYPFYALIEDTTDMEEGSAEIYLSGSAPDMENAIYLENFFVRSETDGRTYVYKQGDDGHLTKQYVTTGKKMYGYAVEIAQGLSLSDRIAFPYGKNVEEGAKTKEVDMLQDVYM